MFARVATRYTVTALVGVGFAPDRDRGSTRDGLNTPMAIARNVKRERKKKMSTNSCATSFSGSGHTLLDHGSFRTNRYDPEDISCCRRQGVLILAPSYTEKI